MASPAPIPPSPKLLITYETEGTLFRGTEIHVHLKFENIGEIAFPLEVRSIAFDLPRSRHTFDKLPETRTLNTFGSFTHSLDVTPQEEGLGWLNIEVRPKDQRIECFQSRDATPSFNQWSGIIYVRKPEDYRIIELLEKIASQLESRR